jgi:hypothetical protein
MSAETETVVAAEESNEASAVKVITWFSVGIAVAAVGIFVGRELRNRYRFNHRTPYDFYANAGESQAGEFGVGI